VDNFQWYRNCNSDANSEAGYEPMYRDRRCGTQIAIESCTTQFYIYPESLLCATASPYHTSVAMHRHMCLDTVLHVSVIRYILLTRIHMFNLYGQRKTQPKGNENLVHQFCHQLSATPPVNAAKDQFSVACMYLTTETPQSPHG